MHSFKDNKERTWSLTIDVNAIKRVRGLLDVDLLTVIDGKLIQKLLIDAVLLCDVIYCLVKPEADEKNVTDEDFGSSMIGDPIDDATTALLEELVDFFPGPKRAILRKALEKIKRVETLGMKLANERLDDPKLDEEIESILGRSSGNLPELLE